MYEIGEESGALEFCHNPFSMPQGGLKALEEAEGDTEKLLNIKADQEKLKELVGHTPLQVCMGALLGIATGILCNLSA